MPGRGLAALDPLMRSSRLTPGMLDRAIRRGLLHVDLAVVVTTPPQADGRRRLGTVNGFLGAALQAAAGVVVEEDPDLPVVPGSAWVAPEQVRAVRRHDPAPYVALSRQPDPVDHRCAENVSA